MEIFTNEMGAIGYVGVPSRPDFKAAYFRKLAEFGITACHDTPEEAKT